MANAKAHLQKGHKPFTANDRPIPANYPAYVEANKQLKRFWLQAVSFIDDLGMTTGVINNFYENPKSQMNRTTMKSHCPSLHSFWRVCTFLQITMRGFIETVNGQKPFAPTPDLLAPLPTQGMEHVYLWYVLRHKEIDRSKYKLFPYPRKEMRMHHLFWWAGEFGGPEVVAGLIEEERRKQIADSLTDEDLIKYSWKKNRKKKKKDHPGFPMTIWIDADD